MKELTDEELIALYKSGDAKALETLMKRYKDIVTKCTRQFFLTGGSSEDLVQDGMIALFKAIVSYKQENGLFVAYATTCVRNRVYDVIKQSNRFKNSLLNKCASLYEPLVNCKDLMLIDVLNVEVNDPQTLAINQETLDNLKKALRCLTPVERKIFNLYLEGESYLDIATKMEKDVKAIDNALQKIKNKLKAKLEI
ncbi:MAG: sigma-70 family RNA polymerase sigma factor [Clostridia bacterium]